MKLTNKTDSPKIVNSRTGGVTLQPGETRDIDVSDEEAASMKRLGFLDPSSAENPQQIPVNPSEQLLATLTEEQREEAGKLANDNKADELKALAEKEGVKAEDGDTKATLAAKIVAKRANG